MGYLEHCLEMFSPCSLIQGWLVSHSPGHIPILHSLSSEQLVFFLQFFHSLKPLAEVCPESLASTMTMSLHVLACSCGCCPIHTQCTGQESWTMATLFKEEKLNPPTDYFLLSGTHSPLSLLEPCSTHGSTTSILLSSSGSQIEMVRCVVKRFLRSRQLYRNLNWDFQVSCLQQAFGEGFNSMARCSAAWPSEVPEML